MGSVLWCWVMRFEPRALVSQLTERVLDDHVGSNNPRSWNNAAIVSTNQRQVRQLNSIACIAKYDTPSLRNSIHPPLPETNLTSSSQTLPGWCKRDRPQPPGSTYLTHLYTGDGERGGLSKNLLLKGMIDSDRVRTLVLCTVVYDDSGSGDFERAYQE